MPSTDNDHAEGILLGATGSRWPWAFAWPTAHNVLALLSLSVCFVLLFLASVSLGGGFFPVAELDPSWQTVLGFASKNRLQFGTDIIFTASPLGYLSSPYGLGTSLTSHLIFALLFSAYTALASTILVRDLQDLARVLQSYAEGDRERGYRYAVRKMSSEMRQSASEICESPS